MHAISFMLKRAHLQALAFGRNLLWKTLKTAPELTPARFDLLYQLRRGAIVGGPHVDPLSRQTQAALQKDLGLHRSTVAKMLKRLEEIGWVRRDRCATDARTKVVRLTPAGLRVIWRVMRRIFRSRSVRRAYAELFANAQPNESPIRNVRRAVWMCSAIARHFGDSSRVYYEYGAPVPSGEHYWDDADLWRRRQFIWQWPGAPQDRDVAGVRGR